VPSFPISQFNPFVTCSPHKRELYLSTNSKSSNLHYSLHWGRVNGWSRISQGLPRGGGDAHHFDATQPSLKAVLFSTQTKNLELGR
jgi:hypothetical protein